MNPIKHFPTFDRRVLLSALAMLPVLSASLRSTPAVGAGAARSAAVLERGRDQGLDPRLCRARHDARRAFLRAGRAAHRDLRQ